MPSPVRSKICGITNPEDALVAIAAGADALGLVFYPPSPRCVNVKQAQAICAALPPFVSVVALFVDAEQEQIEQCCSQLPISLLQFHGEESEQQCSRYRLPYIKALRIRTAEDVSRAEGVYHSAQGLLVDTYKAGTPGGTGESFDWSLLPDQRNKPLILAGGLNPDNVRQAITQVKPYAVDVSGGVERAKGLKDHQKIIRFLDEVSGGRK